MTTGLQMNAKLLQLHGVHMNDEAPAVEAPLKRKPVIGANYDGKHAGFADTRAGVYWEALFPIEADAAHLQKGLLNWARKERERQWKELQKAKKAEAKK